MLEETDTGTVPVEDVTYRGAGGGSFTTKTISTGETVHIQYVLLEFTDVTPENVLDVTDVHHMLMDIT